MNKEVDYYNLILETDYFFIYINMTKDFMNPERTIETETWITKNSGQTQTKRNQFFVNINDRRAWNIDWAKQHKYKIIKK